MKQCWEESPDLRPDFHEIKKIMNKILTNNGMYVDFYLLAPLDQSIINFPREKNCDNLDFSRLFLSWKWCISIISFKTNTIKKQIKPRSNSEYQISFGITW